MSQKYDAFSVLKYTPSTTLRPFDFAQDKAQDPAS